MFFFSLLSTRWRSFAEKLYREYHHILRRRAWRLLRDDSKVDDALQEIFMTICKQCENYRGDPENILPWLYRITTTHCLKLLEKEKRWTRNVGLALEEGAARYEHNLTRQELEHKVAAQELLERLPPRQREAIIYRYASGMSQREIAEVMQVTRDQVRTWLSQFEERAVRWSQEESGA